MRHKAFGEPAEILGVMRHNLGDLFLVLKRRLDHPPPATVLTNDDGVVVVGEREIVGAVLDVPGVFGSLVDRQEVVSDWLLERIHHLVPVLPGHTQFFDPDHLRTEGPLVPTFADRVAVDELRVVVAEHGAEHLELERFAAALSTLQQKRVTNLATRVLNVVGEPVEEVRPVLSLADEVEELVTPHVLGVGGEPFVGFAERPAVDVDVELALLADDDVLRRCRVVGHIINALAAQVVEQVERWEEFWSVQSRLADLTVGCDQFVGGGEQFPAEDVVERDAFVLLPRPVSQKRVTGGNVHNAERPRGVHHLGRLMLLGVDRLLELLEFLLESDQREGLLKLPGFRDDGLQQRTFLDMREQRGGGDAFDAFAHQAGHGCATEHDPVADRLERSLLDGVAVPPALDRTLEQGANGDRFAPDGLLLERAPHGRSVLYSFVLGPFGGPLVERFVRLVVLRGAELVFQGCGNFQPLGARAVRLNELQCCASVVEGDTFDGELKEGQKVVQAAGRWSA